MITDKHWLSVARCLSLFSTTDKEKTCCVATKDDSVIAWGTNGSYVDKHACKIEVFGKDPPVRNIIDEIAQIQSCHASVCLVLKSACVGKALVGSTVFSTHDLCDKCKKLLASCGVSSIVCEEGSDVER